MYQRADILDDSQDLKRPLATSVILHVLVVGGFIGAGLYNANQPKWGSEDAGGGAVGISVENSIPVPQAQGQKNPLANDTESEIAPDKEKRKDDSDKEALEKLLAEDMKKLQSTKPRNDVTSPLPKDPNQLTSATGNRVSSPLFAGMVGSGGIGVGSSAFGNQFGAYLQVVQQRISSRWRASDVDARLKDPPPVLISFTILRSGEVRDVRVLQSVGNRTFEISAQRAVVEAAPFEPLPMAYKGESATIEVAFKLER
jgi:protein TonB